MTGTTWKVSPAVFATVASAIGTLLLTLAIVPQVLQRQARMDILRDHIGQMARIAAGLVDGDLHALLTERSNYTPERYSEALRPLVRFHGSNSEISRVRTMAVAEGKPVCILDTASDAALARTHNLLASAYFEPQVEIPGYADEGLREQLATGRVWVSPQVRKGDRGTFLSGRAPILDSPGHTAGFVAIEYDASSFLGREARFRHIGQAGVATALLLSIALGYAFAFYHRNLSDEASRHYESSLRDPLTQLLNRRGAVTAVHRLLRGDADTIHALLLLDIDDFKSINDKHGHAAGDAVIVHLAGLIRECTRASDIGARLGGDEFLIFVPGCDLPRAAELARRLIRQLQQPAHGRPAYTVSIGIGLQRSRDADYNRLYRQADSALYRAKAGGKGDYACAGVTGHDLEGRGPSFPIK